MFENVAGMTDTLQECKETHSGEHRRHEAVAPRMEPTQVYRGCQTSEARGIRIDGQGEEVLEGFHE